MKPEPEPWSQSRRGAGQPGSSCWTEAHSLAQLGSLSAWQLVSLAHTAWELGSLMGQGADWELGTVSSHGGHSIREYEVIAQGMMAIGGVLWPFHNTPGENKYKETEICC